MIKGESDRQENGSDSRVLPQVAYVRFWIAFIDIIAYKNKIASCISFK